MAKVILCGDFIMHASATFCTWYWSPKIPCGTSISHLHTPLNSYMPAITEQCSMKILVSLWYCHQVIMLLLIKTFIFIFLCTIQHKTLAGEKFVADLAVNCQSAKVLSAKKFWGLVSSDIEWALPLPTAKVFFANFFAVPIPPKFSPAKVLCYMVT